MSSDEKAKKPRGFAAMAPEKRSEIASRGGKAAHELGVGHQFTSEEARAAGRKGGAKVAANAQHMAAIGRVGGTNRHKPRPAEAKADEPKAE